MLPLYIERRSPIHRLSAQAKLLALFAGATVIALIKPVWALMAALVAIALLYALARLPARAIASALKPVIIFAAIIFALQWAFAGPVEAARTLLRILSLVLLAALVTLSTPLSDMIDALTAAARPLARLGLSPPRFALAAALALRFIPVLLNDYREIEAARAARGAKYPGLGAAGPLLIKTLQMTGALSEAITARGFENRK